MHARVRRVYTVAVHHRPATSGHGGLAFSVGEAPFHVMYAHHTNSHAYAYA
nr:MAG TPA: hypothetical protein [Caudoviricetes sp.]